MDGLNVWDEIGLLKNGLVLIKDGLMASFVQRTFDEKKVKRIKKLKNKFI